MFALRMPGLIPQFEETGLPNKVQAELNALLLDQGTHLLERRDGLVVAIAESVRRAMDMPAAPLPAHVGMPNQVRPGTVAARVMEWLRSQTPEELAIYGVAVESALQLQLGSYEDYEEGVLIRINKSMDSVMRALDLEAGPAITPVALSHICGRTIRDWGS